MAIAPTIEHFLNDRHVTYRLLPHPYSSGSMETAEVSHVPGHRLAKSVLLEDENGGYVLAVVPSNRHVDLACVHRLTGRLLGLATEAEVTRLFPDLNSGAAPVLGAAYGIETIVDEGLSGADEVFFDAGDHADLVGLSGKDFDAVTADATHLPIARDVPVHH